KDGTVRYVLYSSDKSQHTMAHIKNKKLTKEQFREYVETMSQSSIFQSGIISKKHEISLLLNISEQNISLYDHNNIDKKLY
ncbi:hypothetical protein SB724_21390, partial [Bacillus sp. SIMBA_031]